MLFSESFPVGEPPFEKWIPEVFVCNKCFASIIYNHKHYLSTPVSIHERWFPCDWAVW